MAIEPVGGAAGDDRPAGQPLAGGGAHAGRPAALDEDGVDLDPCPELAAVPGDERDEGVGEPAAAADGRRVAGAQQRHRQSGPEGPAGVVRSQSQVQQPGQDGELQLLAAEAIGNEVVPGTGQQALVGQGGAGGVLQGGQQRRGVVRSQVGAQQRQQRLQVRSEVGHQPAPRPAVAEPVELRRQLCGVGADHRATTVRERGTRRDRSLYVAQAVAGQFGTEFGEHRAEDEARVQRRVGVVDEARKRELLAAHPATGDIAAFQEADPPAGASEVGRGDQGVVPGTDEDHVVRRGGGRRHALNVRKPRRDVPRIVR